MEGVAVGAERSCELCSERIQIAFLVVVCECFVRMGLVVDLVLQRGHHLFQAQLCAFLDALVICVWCSMRT